MKRKFAAFDIDGTFFRSHLYWEMVLALARDDKLHPEINQKALALYDAWKRRTHDKAFEDFDHMTISAINDLITEIDPKIYDSYLEKVITPLLDHVYMYTKRLMNELKSKGYFVLAISGSRKEEVEIFAKYHGFDDWIGQDIFRSKDGSKYTGEVFATFDSKKPLLENFIRKHNLSLKDSFAIGDTSGDISMLEMVENPIAFNPNQSLLKYAKEKRWKIVIERKSIAFELEPENGSYILA